MLDYSKGQIILTTLPLEELRELLKSDLLEVLNQGINQKPKPTKLLSVDDACDFLHVSKPTLHLWTNNGTVKAHRIGSRKLYKESELLESLKPVKTFRG